MPKLQRMFNQTVKTPRGSYGFDNQRENIDPHIKTSTISSKQFNGELTFTGDGMVFGEICIKDNSTEIELTQNVKAQVNFDTDRQANNTTPDSDENHITID